MSHYGLKYSVIRGRFYLRRSFSKSQRGTGVIIIVRAGHTVCLEIQKRRKKTENHATATTEWNETKRLLLALTRVKMILWAGKRDSEPSDPPHQIKRTRLCTLVPMTARVYEWASSKMYLSCKLSGGTIKRKNGTSCAARRRPQVCFHENQTATLAHESLKMEGFLRTNKAISSGLKLLWKQLKGHVVVNECLSWFGYMIYYFISQHTLTIQSC